LVGILIWLTVGGGDPVRDKDEILALCDVMAQRYPKRSPGGISDG
jgi:hypothetical protein